MSGGGKRQIRETKEISGETVLQAKVLSGMAMVSVSQGVTQQTNSTFSVRHGGGERVTLPFNTAIGR